MTGATYDAARLRNLPRTLEYTGEFGLEILLFLPFVTWLSQAGLLRGRTIKTYAGMMSFYSGLDYRAFVEKQAPREFVSPMNRLPYLPVRSEHDFDGLGRSPFHAYQDFRRKFEALPLPQDLEAQIASRPLLIIHNKHTDEWNSGPVNHISLETLDALFARLGQAFTVVYIRHGIRRTQRGYVGDDNTMIPFDDESVLSRYSQINLFDDLFDRHRTDGGADDVNAFKNALCSRAFRFITSQGGGAHHLAHFSGSMMAILHRKGKEEQMAYADGYYSFLANPSPIRLCCRTEAELIDASDLMLQSKVIDGRVLLPPDAAPVVDRLSPWRLRAR